MIISVASGKGGTGKTLVATSLALSLKDKYEVTLLDCDVEEPNDHVFLKPSFTVSAPVYMQVPRVNEDKCTYCGKCAQVCVYKAIAVMGKHVLTFPQLCHSCGACSYLCPEKAISEEPRQTGLIEWGSSDKIKVVRGTLTVGEAMAPPVIKKVREYSTRDGITIRDVPPGTSCPVVEAVKDSDFCLLVTEPTPFGLNDLELAVETIKELGMSFGVVLNRAVMDNSSVEEYCRKQNIPLLLTIPLDTRIAILYSHGITLAEGMPGWKDNFVTLFNSINGIINGKQQKENNRLIQG
jgi:MinD superfamily P-loop ATPase